MTDSADAESPAEPRNSQPRMSPMSAGQKMFLRISGIVAMALFLLPTFYVVKYFAVDRAPETRLVVEARAAIKRGANFHPPKAITPDDLPMLVEIARHEASPASREAAIGLLGGQLQKTSLSFRRPIEAMTGKAALADIAVHDTDPGVRAAAQDELGKIAQGGAVVRR